MDWSTVIVGFVYNLLRAFDITPAITENTVMNIIGEVLTFLGLIGVIVDPTTDGIGDSNRAMTYTEQWKDMDDEPTEINSPYEGE